LSDEKLTDVSLFGTEQRVCLELVRMTKLDTKTKNIYQIKQMPTQANFANIIGLPLLLGIGIDSGIHITDRFRQEHNSKKNIFMTSSSRGVFVSSLTTICSIGNLAFSSHQGTASMGLLLSIGLTSMMISTMLVLPAFLIWRDSLNPGVLNHD